MSMVAAIKLYLRLGLSLIPIKHREKRPLVEWEEFAVCRADGKQWSAWWKAHAPCNVAVVYGGCETPPGQQLVCVDTDSPEVEAWVQGQAVLPPTPTAKTANGCHRYYLAPAGLPHFDGSPTRPEVRAGTHYTVLPPSTHPSGLVYEWLPGLAIGGVALADLPPWGIALMRGEDKPEQARRPAPPMTAAERVAQYGKTALGREVADLSAAHEGGRNSSLNAAAYALGQLVGGGVLVETDVRQALIGACHANGLIKDDGLRAVERTLDSGLQSGMKEPRTPPQRQSECLAEEAADDRPEPPPLPEVDEDGVVIEEQVRANVNGLRPAHETRQPRTPPPSRLCDVAGEMIGTFEEYRLRPRVVMGLRSGFRSLDNHFLGFSQFPMIVVQGPSGYGKTLFANHCIFATALAEMESPSPALTVVFLCESTKQQLMSMYLGYRWGLPREVREPGSENHLTAELTNLLARGYAEFPMLPIAVHDNVKDIGEIETHIRNMVAEGPVAGVVIDHAQELETPRCRSRHDELNMVALRFRDLGEKLQVPIMLLSQTKMVEGNYEPEYSKALRQKAWLCFVVDRGEAGMKREQAVQSNVTRVICDKSRGWPVSPLLILQGDWRTGRLWELEEYARMVPGTGEETGRSWPGND